MSADATRVLPEAARRSTLRGAAFASIRRSGAGYLASSAARSAPRRPAADDPQVRWLSAQRGRRLAILAHWSPDGGLDAGFRHLATQLRGAGYAVIVVTTATGTLDDFAERTEDFADAVIVRGNEGFDFQSWRRGIEAARSTGWDFERLILANSSMHGPLFSLEPLLARMASHPTWGMTESLDLMPHVQSWWLAFGPAVLTDPRFDRYWGRIRPDRNKWGTILAHELRWSRDLGLAGPTAAFVPVADHRCRRNPLFFAWRELVRDWKLPFVKRSLFGPNYDRIDMTGWQAFLADVAPDFDQRLIQ